MSLSIAPIMITTVLVTCTLSACSSVAGPGGYPSRYLDAESRLESQSTNPAQSTARARAAFENVFGHLKSPDLAERIGDSYAEALFFNDTFRTIEERAELVEYLVDTAGKTPENHVDILSVASDGRDHYIRWRMRFTFKVYGKEYSTDSIGMTHVQLNEDGKIVLHQDFWDSVEGFYQHLPMIGYWLKRIRSNL